MVRTFLYLEYRKSSVGILATLELDPLLLTPLSGSMRTRISTSK